MPDPVKPILEITLYSNDENGDEVKKTYTRSIIPWRILKKAIQLTSINTENFAEADVDKIAALVVEAFGDQFSLDEVNAGAELSEMMTILVTIVTKASTTFEANPTLAQSLRVKI